MKRVVTKVGDVFKTKNDEYIQLVAIDYIQLGGDVIAYYGKVDLNLIPTVPIKFYHHNTMAQGVKIGLWEKVGKRPLPDLSKFVFKQYFDQQLVDMDGKMLGLFRRRPYWTTWTPLDDKWKKISYHRGLKLVAEDGGVAPAMELDFRINHGYSNFKSDWPEL